MRGAGDRAALARQLRELSGSRSAFDVGAWLETARLATASGRLDYFRADGEARASLRRIIEAVERDHPTWSVIIAQLNALETEALDASRLRVHVDSAMAALPR